MKRWILAILRIAIGLLFIIAGVEKLANPLLFAENITDYDVLSPELSMVVARYLPVLEVLAGLAMIANYFVLGGTAVVGALNAFFAVMVGVAVVRGLSVDCGCFSESGKASVTHVLFNLALCAACVVIYRSSVPPALTAPEPA